MNAALRAAMVLLVLVNLGFVFITEAAEWTWLAPLVALTLAAPLLQRLTRFFAYRMAWNLAVIGAFTLLVRHLFTAGAQFLLEDGLLLAALCQVHLLNNIGHGQKPDLLFFNSFLIAVVTSFLSLDLGYSIVFVVYAPLLVVAMELLTHARAGIEGPPGPVIRDGLARGAVAVALTLGVFFLLPRDFDRRGLLGERLGFAPAGLMEVDFTEQVNLDRSGDVRASDRVVIRARVERGTRAGVPGHWRGATLEIFDGRQWYPRTRQSRFLPDGVWSRRGGPPGARVAVRLQNRSTRRLFVPLEGQRVELPPSEAELFEESDRTFRYRQAGSGGLEYRVEFDGGTSPPRDGAVPTRWSRHIAGYLQLHMGSVPYAAIRVARERRARVPRAAPQHAIVEEMRGYLTARYRYLPPGADGGARSLAEFFGSKAAGHCEIFATALAVMLRSQRIPARLVTGYRSEEWDESHSVLTVRARHAHAWVEVYDPAAGWYTVDPTPPAGDLFTAAGSDWWTRLKVGAADLWSRVLGFNERGRERALRWLAALPGRPSFWATVLGLVGILVLLRRRRRARIPAEARRYARVVRSLRLDPAPGETPRELLVRARREDVHPDQLRGLEEATRRHERARYHARA